MNVRVLQQIALCALTFCVAAGDAYAGSFSCRASWYGPGLEGNTMANGQTFRMNDPTIVAHKTLPFGTRLRLTNTTNGQQHDAIVKDRGPYVGGRCLDVSKALAARLGFLTTGTTRLHAEILH